MAGSAALYNTQLGESVARFGKAVVNLLAALRGFSKLNMVFLT